MSIKSNKIMLFSLVMFLSLFFGNNTLAKKQPTNQTVLKIKTFSIQKKFNIQLHKKSIVRLMTLNLAHGSNNRFGLVPMFTSRRKIKHRLQQNALIIKRESPDVVAFQEADGPSWWSGRFHHVNYLAKHAQFRYAILGIHVKTKSKRYGTALISRLHLSHTISYKFTKVGLFKKGFVIATIQWPSHPSLKVDIVSLHLHPSNLKIQRYQVKEVIQFSKTRKRPVIIMGDFNNTWNKENSPLWLLAFNLKMQVYKANLPNMYTHRALHKRRLDWILIPPHFHFVHYRVIRDVISDHYGVVADILYLPPKRTLNIKKLKTSSHPKTSKKKNLPTSLMIKEQSPS